MKSNIGSKYFFYAFAIFVCIILFSYALCVFPIPGSDSIVFLPPALSYSRGLGFTNPLYFIARYTDLTHANKFNYYVPLYPFLLGSLSKVRPGIPTIFFFCALFSSANLLIYSKVISALWEQEPRPLFKISILLSVVYISIYLLPTVGRPENLTCLFVFLVYLLYKERDKIGNAVYFLQMTILLSLILSTQIVCYYFCFLFFVLYEIMNSKNVYKTILWNTLLLCCTLSLFCLIVQLSPIGLVSTINGIRTHVDYVFTRSDRSIELFIYYWLFAPNNFGFLILFILGAIFFIREVYVRLTRSELIKRALIALLLLALIGGIVKFILYASPTIYNASEFILPLTAYVIFNINKVGYKSQKAFMWTAAITFFSGTVIFLRTLILFADDLKHEKNYSVAKAVISKYAGGNRNIYITNGMWTLFDDLDKLKLFNESNYKTGDTVIVQQAYGRFPDSLRDKCTIIYDWRRYPEEVRFWGMKIANGPHDYSFVICKIK